MCVQPGETSRGVEEDKSSEGAARSGMNFSGEACLSCIFQQL
jgi:hypothetical protein